MRYIFVTGDVVVALAHISDTQNGVAASTGPAGSTTYVEPDTVQVDIGYTCTLANGVPSFAAPPITAQFVPRSMLMSQFWVAMTTIERAAMRAHTDPLVKEFVATCTDPRFTTINTALPGPQFDINYAAGVVRAPTGATNAGAFITKPPIAGATRAAQILAGDVPAAEIDYN